MSWNSNDGSANHEMGSFVSNDGSANHYLQTFYSNDGSANHLLFSSSSTLYPGGTWSKRGSMLGETTGPGQIICRDTQGVGDTSAVYMYVDITSYSYLKMDIRVYYCAIYGQVLVGIGNFDSFDIYSWPTVTNGWAWESGSIKQGNYGLVFGSQYTPLHFNLDIRSLSGTKCIGLCAVSRSSRQATSHVGCTKIWLE